MRLDEFLGDLRVVSLAGVARGAVDAGASQSDRALLAKRGLLLESLEAESARMASSRRARRLARVLLNQLGLYSQSIELVTWMDGCAESDNLTLLMEWVQGQLSDEDFECEVGSGTEVQVLMRRLTHHLAMQDAANDDSWGA